MLLDLKIQSEREIKSTTETPETSERFDGMIKSIFTSDNVLIIKYIETTNS